MKHKPNGKVDMRGKCYLTDVKKVYASNLLRNIKICQNCKQNNTVLNGFKVLCICNSEYASKIQEALFIKRHNPQLNLQLQANVLSFVLNVC